MMLPILISLSLAPGSYFFCAAAGYIPTKMLTTRDASTTPRDRFMSPSPDIAGCSPIMRQSRVQALNLSSHETGQRAVLLAAHVTFLEYPGDERTRSAAMDGRTGLSLRGIVSSRFAFGHRRYPGLKNQRNPKASLPPLVPRRDKG